MNYLPKKKSDVEFNGTISKGTSWKNIGVSEVQKEFDDRFDDIKKQYEDLQEEFYWNKLVYESNIKIELIIGKVYHLYENSKDDLFLSIISPNEWNQPHVGSFKLKYNGKWKKL